MFEELLADYMTWPAAALDTELRRLELEQRELDARRLAARAAVLLMGKHKPDYTPFLKTGDHVVVVNAAKVRLTGKKEDEKIYTRHSGYPGGIYETTFGKMQQRFPGRALEKAVKGMLPKGPLGYAMIKKLKVYAEAEHPHEAQQPKALEI